MVVYGFLSYYDGLLKIPDYELMENTKLYFQGKAWGKLKKLQTVLKKCYDKEKHHTCLIEKYYNTL